MSICGGFSMRKLLILILLPVWGWAQPPVTFNGNTVASASIMNSNLSALYTGRIGRWVGAGAPGDLPFSLIGDTYFDTNSPGVIYNCYKVHCTAVGANNWVTTSLTATAVTPGAYTAANITVNQAGQITAATNGITGLTTNRLSKATSATAIGNSSITDDGSTVSTALAMTALSFTTTGSPPTCPVTGCMGIAPKAVGSLGTCNAAAKGAFQVVNDALSPAFLTTIAAGGSALSPVVCNGTNWVAF